MKHIFSEFLTEFQSQRLIEENENHTRNIMKHIKSIVSDLKFEGLKIGVISNFSFEESSIKIDFLDIEKYIDFVITPSNFFQSQGGFFVDCKERRPKNFDFFVFRFSIKYHHIF